MILLEVFYRTVEFYVLATFMAAAVLAYCVKPSRRGSAVQRFEQGWLTEGELDAEPALYIVCLDSGGVQIRRTGLPVTGASGAVSLAIEQIGFDLDCKERRVDGAGAPMREAVFVLTFLGSEWYHINYHDEASGRFAAFSLHVRPGIKMRVPLKQ